MINKIEFKKALLDADMTQVDLCQKIGISKNTLTNWLDNATSPTLEYVSKMAEALGIAEDHDRLVLIFLGNVS